MVSQVYHGTRYIDEVVGLRLQDGRAYVHQDANYNVIGLTDLTGRVLERYYYSPYGELEVAFDAHFFDYDDDGHVDGEDLAAATSSGECWDDYSGDCRRLDADADRDIDAADYAAISNFLAALSGDQEIQRVPAPTHSKLGNPFAHQGLVFDSEIGSYQNRDRQYNPHLKRFMQRDPAHYVDGLSMYGYVGMRPIGSRDPSGTVEIPHVCDRACPGGDGKGCRSPWCPDGSEACTLCDGQGNIQICFDPDKTDVPNPAANEECDPSSISNPLDKCLCVHENTHMSMIKAGDKGCGSGGSGSDKCGGNPPVDATSPPDCCDPCFEYRTEFRANEAQLKCLQEQPNVDWSIRAGVSASKEAARQAWNACKETEAYKKAKRCGCK